MLRLVKLKHLVSCFVGDNTNKGKGKYLNETTNLLLISGFCGGFTTFSTFAMQGQGMLLEQKPFQAILYIGLSVVVGLALAYLGLKLTK